MWERAHSGPLGYGDVKKDLFEKVLAHFAEARARRAELEKNPDAVEDVLARGVGRARELMRPVLEAAREASGRGAGS